MSTNLTCFTFVNTEIFSFKVRIFFFRKKSNLAIFLDLQGVKEGVKLKVYTSHSVQKEQAKISKIIFQPQLNQGKILESNKICKGEDKSHCRNLNGEKFSNMVTRTMIVQIHTLQNCYYACGQITKFSESHCMYITELMNHLVINFEISRLQETLSDVGFEHNSFFLPRFREINN